MTKMSVYIRNEVKEKKLKNEVSRKVGFLKIFMKKEIRVINTEFLELKDDELRLFMFLLWNRNNKNMANKDYASSALAAKALGKDQRTVFRLFNRLYDKGWIDRAEGDIIINPDKGMGLMIDATNPNRESKHEDRSKKSYLDQPHIREAFKHLFTEKQTDRVLDEILKRADNVNNWHSYAMRSIEKSEYKRAKKAQKLELKEGY